MTKYMLTAAVCLLGLLMGRALRAAEDEAAPPADSAATPAAEGATVEGQPAPAPDSPADPATSEPPAAPQDSRMSPAPGLPQAPEPPPAPQPVTPPGQVPAQEPGSKGPAPGDGEKPPLRFSQQPEVIEKFVKHYLETYKKHLQSDDWIARAMAVIGLAMIDDVRSTNLLVGVMEDDKAPIVQLYAWEALHARQSKIDPKQRAQWKRRCFDFAEKNLLRGDMRIGLVGLVEEDGPRGKNKDWLKRIFVTTNSINPSDIRTLWAMGDAIKRWQSGDLVLWLVNRMKVLDDAYRAELVLRRIHDQIPAHGTLRLESSEVMWGVTYQRWMKWYKEQKFKELKPFECTPYVGRGEIMPPGEKITDTADPKWRRDLELRRFHLDQLDVGLALDTTASMGRPLEWVKRDVVKMMRAFELISREPRIGVTLYRDHGDEFVTRNIPLTSSAVALQKVLMPERPKGGGDVPEAVYDALVAMVNHQKWSPSETARKVVVVMGDSPPKEDSVGKIEEFVKGAVDRGFTVHCIKVQTSKYIERVLKLPNYDPKLTTFDRVAQWGNGTSEWVAFWTQSQVDNPRWLGTARPTEGNLAERVILRQVLRAALDMSYKERVDGFIGVLLEYVEEPLKETRKPFPKATPGRASTPRDPQMNR